MIQNIAFYECWVYWTPNPRREVQKLPVCWRKGEPNPPDVCCVAKDFTSRTLAWCLCHFAGGNSGASNSCPGNGKLPINISYPESPIAFHKSAVSRWQKNTKSYCIREYMAGSGRPKLEYQRVIFDWLLCGCCLGPTGEKSQRPSWLSNQSEVHLVGTWDRAFSVEQPLRWGIPNHLTSGGAEEFFSAFIKTNNKRKSKIQRSLKYITIPFPSTTMGIDILYLYRAITVFIQFLLLPVPSSVQFLTIAGLIRVFFWYTVNFIRWFYLGVCLIKTVVN